MAGSDDEIRLADRLFVTFQRLLPTRALSTLVHHLAGLRLPVWKRLLIALFRRAYRIDLSEAQQPDAESYASFNAFFTRALKPQARPLPDDRQLLVSPVDGRISQRGDLVDGRLLQAKGHDYTLDALLAGDASAVQAFRGGRYCTIYLAPTDYHRIHMPYDGRLLSWTYVPGRLFAVNPPTVRALPGLFARNERLVARFDTAAGALAVVMVGALFVGSLETVWTGKISPPHRRDKHPSPHPMLPPISCPRGGEIGRFNMGSTVILLTGPGFGDWLPTLATPAPVRMGQPLMRTAVAVKP
jgi:phosphatidylserine decarboxylase precursor